MWNWTWQRKLALTSVVGLPLTLAGGWALSQDAGGPQRGGPGGFGNLDPQQMRQQMMDNLKEQLGATDDEWKVLQPMIQKVMDAQRDTRGAGGGFGGRGGRRGGGQGGPGGDRFAGRGGPGGDRFGGNNPFAPDPNSPVVKAGQSLRDALENQNTPAADITRRLNAYREAREQARQRLAAAQKELKELLTPRQEAVLVMNGMVE